MSIDDYTRPATEQELRREGIKIAHCKHCLYPCGIIHDIGISDCHAADIYFQEPKRRGEL